MRDSMATPGSAIKSVWVPHKYAQFILSRRPHTSLSRIARVVVGMGVEAKELIPTTVGQIPLPLHKLLRVFLTVLFCRPLQVWNRSYTYTKPISIEY
ncbi:hypothetical protein K443DRAFT_581186 [Laccaria amethystina LaAM-08-1]|uniref:Uncharacterized protein n=1 Tax=Laccaria amethystina LaAM-08-1 TaxID=1095629 RepID=A0A0C9XHP4_9AGAR|nr:hypothetical protein K443DRAFT_581186 [Laccaria amethystina LaAM-08-1]